MGHLTFLAFAYVVIEWSNYGIYLSIIIVAIFDYSVFIFAIIGIITGAFDDDPFAGKLARQIGVKVKQALKELQRFSYDDFVKKMTQLEGQDDTD